jgi:hypothetical protein
MVFFTEELKNNFWFGLMAKTSKIAPRHVRLTMMYLNIAIHWFVTAFMMTFGYHQILIDDDSTFQNLVMIMIAAYGSWIFTIPVALIFRMPMSMRR